MTATVFISSAHKINVPTSKISPCFCHSFSFIWGKRHVSLNPVPAWVPPPIFCVLTESRHTFQTFKITFTNILDFPGGSDGEESACNVGEPGLIPGSGRCPGKRNGYPLQYSCLKNSMDRGAWRRNPWGCIKSDTTGQLTLSLFQIWCLWFLWVWCSVVCVCVCTHTHTHTCVSAWVCLTIEVTSIINTLGVGLQAYSDWKPLTATWPSSWFCQRQ